MTHSVTEPVVRVTERRTVALLGTPIDRVEWGALSTRIESFITSGQPHHVVTANLHFLTIARRRDEFARVIEDADLVLCDGAPLQWASRLCAQAIPARVTGVDLVLTSAQLSAARGYRIFLLGSRPGVASQAAETLREQYPGVVIAGTRALPQRPLMADEDTQIVAHIRAVAPDVLFVAMGAPRQDEWLSTITTTRHWYGICGVFPA